VTGDRSRCFQTTPNEGRLAAHSRFSFDLSVMQRFAFEFFAREAEENARATPEV
jgi:hypothetical protein